jgi:serine/threonine protein kinase/Tfp pilus assembly protein PilF
MSGKESISDCAPGAKLTHYRILEKIGAGGMGEVFRARDERLDREVAIKILRPGTLGNDPARMRFRKEALTLSKLNHPNVATIHDFDTQDGRDFLVMEYIPGATLSERLRAGSLSEKETVRLGLQLAEGLDAAHSHAIVHRDLKPGNMRITPDGRLKILDFGLATLLTFVSEAAASTVSVGDMPPLAGTLPYMAPEQLLGDLVDARTDIHAAGVLLYEMATGHYPFGAPGGSQLIGAILRKVPAPPRQLNQALSAELERIIEKCLEKEPESRYQSAKELAIDLRRLLTGMTATTHPALRSLKRSRRALIRSIAVLPLANLSGDPQQEYFADGITESLITDLGRLTGLKAVIARGSVMRYKNTEMPPAEIARELNVDALMTGAVVRSINRVRVTAQLIHPESGEQLWTEHYEYDLGDLLQLQNEVTRAIAAEIRVKLTANEQARLATARWINPQAYETYLMGRFHWYKMTPQGLDRAVEYFQLTLDKDPNYAPAYARIGFVWCIRAHTGLLPSREGFTKARKCAVKALELDSTLPEAHDLLGSILTWYEWDWAAGEKEYQRAIELNPNYADVRCFYSYFLHAMRRSLEAKSQIERALELDPYNFFFHMAMGMQLNDENQPDDALVSLQRAATLQPDSLFVHANLWSVFEQKAEYEKALSEARQYFNVLGVQDVVQSLDRGDALVGYRPAMRLAADALVSRSKQTFVSAMNVALLYASAGEEELCLDWLENAYHEHASRLPYLNVLPMLVPLRSHPRFQELVRLMKFPQSCRCSE